MLYTDPGFPMKSSVVPAWYNRPGFLAAMAEKIHASLQTLPADARANAHILYTAQGLPVKYVTDLGDPYQEGLLKPGGDEASPQERFHQGHTRFAR